MVKKYQAGQLTEQQSIREALGIKTEKAPVISIVGAGGKTTFIKQLAAEYKADHIPVIVTTTTHMRIERKPWFLVEPSLVKMAEMLEREGMVWIGLPDKGQKMKAPPQQILRLVLSLEVPVIIEADGAKMLPMKVPATHEPVIVPETTHVVNVYGLDALGETFEDACFRADEAAKLLDREKKDTVGYNEIAALASHKEGGKKGCLPSMKYHVVLNKADTKEKEADALEVCRSAEMQGITELLVTARGRQIEE